MSDAVAIFLRLRRHCLPLFSFFTLFLLLLGHACLETARDALFLSELPAERLPFAYLAIMAGVYFTSIASQALTEKFEKRKLLSVSFFSVAIINAGLGLFHTRHPTYIYTVYIWTGTVATLLVVQFWLLTSELYNVEQAKKRFPAIGLGAVLGATAGSFLASVFLQRFELSHLLFLASSVWCLAATLPLAMLGEARKQRDKKTKFDRNLRNLLLKERYLRKLAAITVLSALVVTLIDFLFKDAVSDAIPRAELGGFFANFYTAANGISFVVQLSAPLLLSKLAVTRVALILPSLLLVGAAGVVGFASLLPVVFLKGVDGSLRHSIDRTTFELLYMPLSSEVKSYFKTMIDGVGKRLGQALASILILILSYWLNVPKVVFAGLLIIFLSAWLIALHGMRHEYTRLFRNRILGGAIKTELDLPKLDLASLEVLLQALNSPDDGTVMGALELLERYQKHHLVPALVLFHPSSDVVLRAFSIFESTQRADHLPIAERLLEHQDPAVRVEAVRHVGDTATSHGRLISLSESQDPTLRITALVCLLTGDQIDKTTLRSTQDALIETIKHGTTGDRIAFLQAERAHTRKSDLLHLFLKETNEEVLAELAQTLAVHPDALFFERLLGMLAIRELRDPARDALVALGNDAIPQLLEAERSPNTPAQVSRHIPRTISRFANQEAADALQTLLVNAHGGVARYKALRGLGRLVFDDALIRVDRKLICREALKALESKHQMHALRSDLERAVRQDPSLVTPGVSLLIGLCAEKEKNALNRSFRLIHILSPKQNFEVLYDAMTADDANRKADALEVLTDRAPADVRRALINAVQEGTHFETADLETGDELSTPEASRSRQRVAKVIRMALRDESSAMRCVAAYSAGELRLNLKHEIKNSRLPPPFAHTFEIALALLEEGNTTDA